MTKSRKNIIFETALKLAEETNADAIVCPFEVPELDTKIPVIHVKSQPKTLDRSGYIEDAAISAYLKGDISGHSVVGISGFGEPDSIFLVDIEKCFLGKFADRVDPDVVRSVLNIVLTLKNRRMGTAFIIGDTKNVLKRSHQLILNPFKGHTVEHRDVKKSENWHVIRKFTQLDGDFVVDNNGIIVTAGRYIDSVSKNIQAQSGLGGRHVSAASITRDTKAVAVTLSKSGAVRVYKDGKMMVEL